MADFIHWPSSLLVPARSMANPVPFTRGGGRTIGGKERAVRTDNGYWKITLDAITVHTVAQRRTWDALTTALNGRAGLISVPVWSFDTHPYPQQWPEPIESVDTLHDDDTPFDDDTPYSQGIIHVEAASKAVVGATSIRLTRVVASADLAGVRFSYKHALYKTGPATSIVGNTWTVPIFPAIRQEIPAGAILNFDLPTCLVRLAEDNGMDIEFNVDRATKVGVNFVEADDYWSDLASGTS